MTFVSVVLIILVCVATSYLILNYRRRQSTIIKTTLPGPKTFPLIGNAYYFLQRSSDEYLDIFIKLTEDYSSPLQLWLGNKSAIVIYESDQIQTILQNSRCLEKSIMYKLAEQVFGKGLLTAPASIWTEQRKIVAPSFNTHMLQKYFDVFMEQSLIFINKLEKVALNGNEVSLLQNILEYAMSSTCGTMSDIKLEHVSYLISQCLEKLTSCKQILRMRIKNIFLYPNFIFNLTAMGREMRKSLNFVHSIADELIQQQMYISNELNTKTKDETNYKSLFHIAIEAFYNNKMKREIVHDNVITIVLAATDTIAHTLDFVILMLANFPDMQEKVYKELCTIYGTKTVKSVAIKYQDLQHMDYLDRVIKETMRIFPPGPIIGRHLTEDVQLGEVMLPKNSEVFISLITMHRNKKYWSNPLIFDPDRFLPEKIGTCYKHYMPFSIGPRNCIGTKYAMVSMKVFLATLVRRFMFKVDKSIQIDEVKLHCDATLSTVEPIKVKIEKRNLY